MIYTLLQPNQILISGFLVSITLTDGMISLLTKDFQCTAVQKLHIQKLSPGL